MNLKDEIRKFIVASIIYTPLIIVVALIGFFVGVGQGCYNYINEKRGKMNETWTKIKMWFGLPLFWIGNWIFLRPAEYLWQMKGTNVGELVFALERSELIDRHGIEGCAMMKSFYDTYLKEE